MLERSALTILIDRQPANGSATRGLVLDSANDKLTSDCLIRGGTGGVAYMLVQCTVL